VLFISFFLINLSEALIVTRVVRFLDPLRFSLFLGFVLVLFFGFILFIVLWHITHAAFLQLLVCKKPPCDDVEAQ